MTGDANIADPHEQRHCFSSTPVVTHCSHAMRTAKVECEGKVHTDNTNERPYTDECTP